MNKKDLISCIAESKRLQLLMKNEKCDITYEKVKKILKDIIILNIKKGFSHFISRMTLGIDLMGAEIVIEIKNSYPNVILESVLSCTNQTTRWDNEYFTKYQYILRHSDIITFLSKTVEFGDCLTRPNNN